MSRPDPRISSDEAPFDPYAYAEAWYEAHPESIRRFVERAQLEMKLGFENESVRETG